MEDTLIWYGFFAIAMWFGFGYVGACGLYASLNAQFPKSAADNYKFCKWAVFAGPIGFIATFITTRYKHGIKLL